MVVELGVTDKIKQLRSEGPRPNERLVRTITSAGHAAVAPLLALATDTALLHDDPPLAFAPIHALRLLGELQSLEIIAPLLRMFPVMLQEEDEELPQLWANEVPQIIGHLGAPALDPLWQIVDDAGWNMAARSAAMTALTYTTAADPALHDHVLAGLRQRLDASDDTTFSSHLAIALANLGVPDLYADFMAMYRAGKITQAIIPAGAARQLLLSDSSKRLRCATHPLWERYDQHALSAAGPAR